MYKSHVLVCWLLLVALRGCSRATVAIDCRHPPRISLNPTTCCLNTGVGVIPQCIKRLGMDGQMPLDAEATARLTECVLTESHLMPKRSEPDLENIRGVLQSLYANDAIYVDATLELLRKCRSIVKRNVLQFQKLWRHQVTPHKYNLVAQTTVGCSGTEHGSSCPANSGTENADCAQAKQFLRQCVWKE